MVEVKTFKNFPVVGLPRKFLEVFFCFFKLKNRKEVAKMQFLGVSALILIAAAIAGQISVRLQLPAVVGELIAGVVLGPALLNWVRPTTDLHLLSELGVIILMFLAGLDSDLGLLKRFGRPSLLVAVLGMVVPIIGGFGTGIAFHFNTWTSIFLGLTLAATSVSISVAVLQEMQQLDSPQGATILAAAVVDDILAVLLLSIVSSLAGPTLQSENKFPNLGVELLAQGGYLLLLLVVSYWLVPRFMALAAKLLIPQAETVIALILCLGLAYLADLVGLSTIIGAFFAGLACGQTSYQKILSKKLNALGYALFIPIFFVSVGLQLTLTGLVQDWQLFLVLTVIGVLTKLIGAGGGAKLAGFSNASALVIGSGMISRGEMALVIAQIGVHNHLLAPDRYSAVVGALILTTIVAPLLLKVSIHRLGSAAK